MANTIDSAGLVLDILGVIIVWWFALPPVIQRMPQGNFFTGGPPAGELAKAARYYRYSRIGLSLLIAGFALQLLSNYIVAIWV